MQKPLMTSLYKLDCHNPCEGGWQALLKHLGIHPSEVGCLETPFKVSEIGKLGNLEWLFWTFCLFEPNDGNRMVYNKAARRVYVEFGVWCAERVRHLLTDAISIKALDVCREYIAGTATLEELKEAATMAYVNNADTVSMHDLESNPPEQQGQHYAAYSVAMASTSLAFRSRPAFESAAYHAAMAMWRMYFSDESYEKERGIQLAKLMELLDREVTRQAYIFR